MGVIASNIKLKKEYVRDGYKATFEKKKGDWYLYRRVGIEEDWAEYVGKPHWEVVKPFKASRLGPDGKERPNRYLYPSAAQWGTYGFTYTSRERAKQKLNELTK